MKRNSRVENENENQNGWKGNNGTEKIRYDYKQAMKNKINRAKRLLTHAIMHYHLIGSGQKAAQQWNQCLGTARQCSPLRDLVSQIADLKNVLHGMFFEGDS